MIELSGITWDHPRGYAPLEASAEKYLEQAGVKITWHRRTLKDFGDTSVDMLSQKYDLLVIDHPHMGTVDQSGCLIDLKKYFEAAELQVFESESVGPSFASYNYKNKQYAIPVDAACQIASYRPNLIDSALLPTTWQEVLSLSEQLKSKKQYIATALCATDCNCTFLTLSAQLGNPATEINNRLIPLNEGVQVLELMRALKNTLHPESLNWNPIKLYDHMVSEDDVVYSPLAFAYINYASDHDFIKRLKFTSIPGRTHSIIGGAGMAVSANSKHTTEAVEYLKWICSPQHQKSAYVFNGGQPGQLSAWTDKKNHDLADSFLTPVLNTINTGYVRPRLSSWPQYQEMVGETIHEYLVKNSSPKTIIEKLNSEYKKILV